MGKKSLLLVIFILIGVAVYLYLAPPKIPEGKVLVNQSYLDSLAYIATLPPDTAETIDTIRAVADAVYVTQAAPNPTEQGEYYHYADSLIEPDVSVWVWDKVSSKGIIEEREWAYRLHVPYRITHRQIVYKTIPKPFPVPVKPINYPKIRYYGMVGFGTQFTVDGGILYNNRIMVGAQGSKNLAVVKVGLVF